MANAPVAIEAQDKVNRQFPATRLSLLPTIVGHQPSMLLGFTLVVLSFLHFSANAATICNGHAEVSRYCTVFNGLRRFNSPPTQFCDRNYGNLTYVGTHDSYAVGVNNRELYKNCFLFRFPDYDV